MQITVYKCDTPNCRKLLEHSSDVFEIHMIAKDTFWDGYERNDIINKLCFCEKCARNIKHSLEIIANK